MSGRLHREAELVSERVQHGDLYWPAQLSIALAILLHLTLADRVTIAPNGAVALVEGALFLGLVAITPRRATHHKRASRRLALGLISLVALANLLSLGLLVSALLDGRDSHSSGEALLLSGAVLWITNVLLFAVLYWELDRGGPVARYQGTHGPLADFQFAQMTAPDLVPKLWRPGFVDYLYLSFTNSTAFSPTDTMPLTATAKLVMTLQSAAALLTLALVVSRAVSILG